MSEPDHRQSTNEYQQAEEAPASSSWSQQSWPGSSGRPPIDGPSVHAEVKVEHMTGGVAAGMYVEQKSILPLDEVVVRPSYLKRVRKTHAVPEGFESLVSHDQRIVLFDLPERAGRTTHAEALADRLASLPPTAPASWPPAADVLDPAGTRRKVSRLMFGGSPHFPVNRLPTEHGKVWLLEIPADEDEFQVVGFGDNLIELDRRLRAQRCHLLVLTRPEQWRRIGDQHPTLWVSVDMTIRTVTPLEVARSQLTGRIGAADADNWLRHPGITAAVKDSSYGVVVEVVESIVAAAATPREMLPSDRTTTSKYEPDDLDDDVVLARRIAMVLDSRGKWRRQLLDWHRAPGRTAFERDFQLTAAAMTELPVAHVYYGTTELNRLFAADSKADTNYLQAVPGVIQMLDAVGGNLTDDDRIRFLRPGWTDAILEYFWLDRPLARGKFIDWLALAPGFQTGDALEFVSDEQRRAVARRIVRFALQWAARQERDAPLAKLAIAWRNSKWNLWKELVDTISAVAAAQDNDPDGVGEEIAPLVKHRGYVHRCLLRWAHKGDVAQVHLVLAVCAGPFADRYTSKALVRLKHAARLLDDQTQPILADVISHLWREPSARATLIAEIAGWCDAEGQRQAGCIAFAQLAEQSIQDTNDERLGSLELLRAAADYAPDHELLGRCWWAFLNTTGAQERKHLLSYWLTAAVTHPGQREAVVTVLRHAARGTTPNARVVRDRIRVDANEWAAERPVPTELYNELTYWFDIDLRSGEQHSDEVAP